MLGLLAVGLGVQIMLIDSPGPPAIVLALGSTVAVIVVALRRRSLLWLAFGVAATLIVVPPVVFEVFGDTLGAPLALLGTGALLVVLAVGLARRGQQPPAEDGAG